LLMTISNPAWINSVEAQIFPAFGRQKGPF
jgi:hypothetical protein